MRTSLLTPILLTLGVLTACGEAGDDPTSSSTEFRYPRPVSGPSYDILITAETNGSSLQAGQYPYIRNLPSGAIWVDGDRKAYTCAYGFLEYGDAVGRFTFVALDDVSGAAYSIVNDKFMLEGVRYFDGSLAPPGTVQTGKKASCPTAEYENLPPRGHQLPIVTFEDKGTGKVLEVRDYNAVGFDTRHTARLVAHGTGSQCRRTSVQPDAKGDTSWSAEECYTVLLYQDNVPVVAVYYDALVGMDLTSSTDTRPW